MGPQNGGRYRQVVASSILTLIFVDEIEVELQGICTRKSWWSLSSFVGETYCAKLCAPMVW